MKKLLLHKKAQFDLYDIIFQIVIAAAAGAALIIYVNYVAGDTTYARAYLAREAAFDISVLYASPNNIFYFPLYYFSPYLVQKFDYDIGAGEIVVSGKKYYYAEDSCFVKYSPALIKDTSTLHVKNSGYDFSFGPEFLDVKEMKYPFVDTKDSGWKEKNFVIAPYEYEGVENKFMKELKNVGETKFGLTNIFVYGSSFSVEPTHGYFYVRAGKENPDGIDVLIPLRTALQSRKLASIMIDEFLKANPDLKMTLGFSKDVVMNQSDVSVALKVGTNINVDTANIIFTSLKEYYEGGIC